MHQVCSNLQLKSLINFLSRLNKEERPAVKELLNNDFFAEYLGLKIEVVNRDEAIHQPKERVEFRLRVLDPKKRGNKHKENEAIQFDVHIIQDDADELAAEMAKSGLIMEEDAKSVAKMLRQQIASLLKDREERHHKENEPVDPEPVGAVMPEHVAMPEHVGAAMQAQQVFMPQTVIPTYQPGNASANYMTGFAYQPPTSLPTDQMYYQQQMPVMNVGEESMQVIELANQMQQQQQMNEGITHEVLNQMQMQQQQQINDGIAHDVLNQMKMQQQQQINDGLAHDVLNQMQMQQQMTEGMAQEVLNQMQMQQQQQMNEGIAHEVLNQMQLQQQQINEGIAHDVLNQMQLQGELIQPTVIVMNQDLANQMQAIQNSMGDQPTVIVMNQDMVNPMQHLGADDPRDNTLYVINQDMAQQIILNQESFYPDQMVQPMPQVFIQQEPVPETLIEEVPKEPEVMAEPVVEDVTNEIEPEPDTHEIPEEEIESSHVVKDEEKNEEMTRSVEGEVAEILDDDAGQRTERSESKSRKPSMNKKKSRSSGPRLSVLSLTGSKVECQLETSKHKTVTFTFETEDAVPIDIANNLVCYHFNIFISFIFFLKVQENLLGEEHAEVFVDLVADLVRQLKENPGIIPVLPATQQIDNVAVGSPVVVRRPRDRDRSVEANVSAVFFWGFLAISVRSCVVIMDL